MFKMFMCFRERTVRNVGFVYKFNIVLYNV